MNELEATRAKLKCLEMVEGTGLKWWEVVRHFRTGDSFSKHVTFSEPTNNYEFALGIVEGKPVWEGDEIYLDGNKQRFNLFMTTPTNSSRWSWSPPKPKIVMVELTVEQAELGAKLGLTTDIASACRKALEVMK